MKTRKLMILIAGAGLLGACAPTVPKELADARQAYKRASTGVTAQTAPAEVHVAGKALAKAEQAFEDDPGSYQTRDLSYVAQRKAQLADATAAITMHHKSQARSRDNFQDAQGRIVDKTRHRLDKSNKALEAAKHASVLTAVERDAERSQRKAAEQQAAATAAERLTAEQQARADAEQRAAVAQAQLARLASVRDESRGMVITLSGSVLFASNKATLLGPARAQLRKVATALLETSDRGLTIEGHTDSQGSESHNLDLSQRRADAVRVFLQQQGYQSDRITARGLGEGSPVADNRSAEGRANNRRVEIVVDHVKTSSR